MNLEKEIKKVKNLAVLGISLAVFGWGGNVLQDIMNKKIIKFEPLLSKHKTKLYQKVSNAANTNKDNLTDNSEWVEVYNELGLKYDIHLSNPRYELSKKQMRKYLENHSQ